MIEVKRLAKVFDHTLLCPDAKEEDIRRICIEAVEWGFFSVVVNPCWIRSAKDALAGTKIRVVAPVGFPFGANLTSTKAFEAEGVIRDGADEIDVVMNIGALKGGDLALVESDIREVVDACGGRVCKVIIETTLLTQDEKIKACKISEAAGASFVKTNTGFFGGGATVEDVALMRKTVGRDVGIKASGGIRTLIQCRALLEAGATRIGCSQSTKIMEEAQRTQG